MYETENPIALQSKRWLVSSSLCLMEKKSFSKITVSEIAEQAQLDRRTFYRNFSSKEDVLSFYIRGLSDEFVVALLNENTLTIPTILRIFFEMAEKYKSFLLNLKKENLLMFLLGSFNDLLPSIHALIEPKFQGNFEAENIEYVFAFNTGGFWNILVKWIDGDFNHSPADMARIVHNLMTKTFPASYHTSLQKSEIK